MLVRLVATALVSLAVANYCDAQELFPYRAFVTADEVAVRSGPGENYYSVMRMARGDTVEVYRHDPGGWYAIRPPEGSFSWVAAEYIRPTQSSLGVVDGDRVVARIGSIYSDIRDCIQVRLDRGEEVEILDVLRTGDENGPKQWYKIAPPAGEFRWVAGRFIDRELRPLKREPSTPLDKSTTNREEPSLYEPSRKAAATAGAEVEAPSNTIATLERRLTDISTQLQSLTGKKAVATGWTAKDGTPVNGTAAKRVLPPSRATTVAESLDELDLQLSEMVTDDTLTWDFRAITDRVEESLSRSETSVERGRARALLFKIEKFEDIRQRYMAVVAQRNGGTPAAGAASSRDTQIARRPDTNVAISADRVTASEPAAPAERYDGSGRLTQVTSQKPGAPPFALLDDDGKVLYYVSPAPGVNLRRYLGQEVGVSGILGFLPDQDVRHVTAKRIETLAGGSLR